MSFLVPNAFIFVVLVSAGFHSVMTHSVERPKPEDPEVIILTPIESKTIYPSAGEESINCLALNIYHESRSDNFAGKLAVADVTINRVESNLFPNSICDVVKQTVIKVNWKGNKVPVRNKCQFSWYCDGKSDDPFEEFAWEEAQSIAKLFLTSDKYKGVTEGATHYHTQKVNPDWVDDRGMQLVGVIGEHKFYRWH